MADFMPIQLHGSVSSITNMLLGFRVSAEPLSILRTWPSQATARRARARTPYPGPPPPQRHAHWCPRKPRNDHRFLQRYPLHSSSGGSCADAHDPFTPCTIMNGANQPLRVLSMPNVGALMPRGGLGTRGWASATPVHEAHGPVEQQDQKEG